MCSCSEGVCHGVGQTAHVQGKSGWTSKGSLLDRYKCVNVCVRCHTHTYTHILAHAHTKEKNITILNVRERVDDYIYIYMCVCARVCK